ncbi:MAG: DUF1295 domain-containing protein [Phocaeicola sp.]
MGTLFLQASLLVLTLFTLLWMLSIKWKNVSIVDLFWGIGFVVVNAFYIGMSGDVTPRKFILLLLVTIWGVRLSIYLTWRNWGKGEDYRYQAFRKKYGAERYWWISFFQTFLLQGLLTMVISLPLLGVSMAHSSSLNLFDYLAMLLWVVGFTFEAGGDYQLARFKKNPQNRGKVLCYGFWKYTRHPNYFGDSAVWWAYALFSIAAGAYWQVIGSVVMTLLIIKVSGVALLEKGLNQTKPHYADYIKKTSSFFPWFPKK